MNTSPPACPFCDKMDLHRIEFPCPDGSGEMHSYVHCNTCGATGPQYREDGVQGWEAWADRAGVRLQ